MSQIIYTNNDSLRQQYNDNIHNSVNQDYGQKIEVLPISQATLLPCALPKFEEVNHDIPNMDYPDLRTDYKTYDGLYVTLWHCSSFKKPAPSLHNLQGMYYYRLHKPQNTSSDLVMIARAKNQLWQIDAKQEWVHEEWMKSLKTKQLLLFKKTYQRLEVGDYDQAIKVQNKCDEKITGKSKFVTRPVFDCSGSFFALLGPLIKTMSHRLAYDVFDYTGTKQPTITIGLNGNLRVYFTCGATSTTLAKFFNDSLYLTDTVSMLVMGDDLAIINNYFPNWPKFIESDFSKFDRSQNKMVLSIWYHFLRSQGFNEEADKFEELMTMPLNVRHRHTDMENLWKKEHKLDMMYTGQPATCLSNSIINIKTTMTALEEQGDLANSYLKMGLTAKILFSDTADITFLKGVFLETCDSDYIWMRLPSFIAKIGATCTGASHVYPNKYTEQQKVELMLWAQWLGFGAPQSNWFYKRIHKNLVRLTQSIQKIDRTEIVVLKENVSEYGVVKDDKKWIPDHIFNAFMLKRYNLDLFDLQNYCRHMEMIPHIPVLVSHPIIQIMIDRDYG